MATQDQSGNTLFTMITGDAGDTHEINVRKTGYYRLKVGGGGTPNFNAQTIAVKQGGDALENLGALAAFSDSVIHLIGGQAVTFVPTGTVTSVQIELVAEHGHSNIS